MSFLDDVEQGRYQTKLTWPSRPGVPPLLSVAARKLSADEIRLLPDIAAKYEVQEREYREQLKACRDDQNRLDNEAYEALLDDYGLDKDDPFVQRMYSLAYEDGHSSGWSSIYGELSDLMPLYELYAGAIAQPPIEQRGE